MRPDNVRRYLEQIIRAHRAELEQGAILSVTEAQIRLRPLPLSLPLYVKKHCCVFSQLRFRLRAKPL